MTTWKMLGVLVRVVLGVWGIVWGLMRVDDPRGAYILVISGLLLYKCFQRVGTTLIVGPG